MCAVFWRETDDLAQINYLGTKMSQFSILGWQIISLPCYAPELRASSQTIQNVFNTQMEIVFVTDS